jgi:hypothetical protein
MKITLNSLTCMAMLAIAPTIGFADEEEEEHHHHAHFDVMPELVDGKIVTGGITHAIEFNPFTETEHHGEFHRYLVPQMRVFTFELGEDPLLPTSSDHPGINNEGGTAKDAGGNDVVTDGTGLPLNSTLSVTILGDLQYWNETGFVAVPDSETMEISYSTGTRTAGTGTGALPPLPVKTFTSNDHVHLHLEATLFDESSDISSATPGVYMIEAILQSSDPGVADSDPFWVIYGYDLADEHELHEAEEWVEVNLVPEPTGLVLLGAGAMIAIGRRRRAARN